MYIKFNLRTTNVR